MPITIFDYVKSVAGEKAEYTAEDFISNGVAMVGGCEICHAMLAAYNAYPSKSGYWRCADCIGGTGFATIEEFTASAPDADAALPGCPERDCGRTQPCEGCRESEEIPDGTAGVRRAQQAWWW